MKSTITLAGGESVVTISGLNDVEGITEAAFDGITVTLTGAAVDNVNDLVLSGSNARRIIWKGKIDGVERDNVLIVDTLTGAIKGSWLVDDSILTYFDHDDPKVTLQFVDKKTALTPRTFTFMEKYNLLSLGSAFDHVTITAHDDVYLSRSQGNIISGVIKGKSKAKIDNSQWTFDNGDSFVAETTDNVVKFYNGRNL